MFALAIWDARRRRLVLARDSFGKKPLYYWSDARRFVFGSEIKALLAAGVPAAMADERLGEYLAFGYVPTPATFFKGIRKLPPASLLVVDEHGVSAPRARTGTSPSRRRARPRPSRSAEAAERVRELLTSAVRKRLVSDVPLGVLLSGGVDSSAVAALMARLVPGRVKTFAVGFEGDAYFDERPHAAQRRAPHRHRAPRIGGGSPRRRAPGRRCSTTTTSPSATPRPCRPTSSRGRRGARSRSPSTATAATRCSPGYDKFWAALLAEPDPGTAAHRSCACGARVLPEGATPPRPAQEAAPLRRQGGRGPKWSGSRAGARSSTCPRSHALTRGGGDGDVLASYREALGRVRGPLAPLAPALPERADVPPRRSPAQDGPHGDGARPGDAQPASSTATLAEYVATLPDEFKRAGAAREGRPEEGGGGPAARRDPRSARSTASACPSGPGSAASCARWSRTRCSTGPRVGRRLDLSDDPADRSTTTSPGAPTAAISSGRCSRSSCGCASTRSREEAMSVFRSGAFPLSASRDSLAASRLQWTSDAERGRK